MQNKNLITVDLGGTKILSALINGQDQIIDRFKESTKITGEIEPIIDGINNSIDKLLENNSLIQKDIKAICLGVPGTVNPMSGIIGYAPNLGIRDYNIKETLSKYYDIPVLIENDVNLAGLGIQQAELKDNVKNMLVVFIGTGIGAALFIDGKLYRGSSFYAGEIGHMRINPKGRPSKKSKLTFENIASRTAVVNAIVDEIKKGKKSYLSDIVKKGKRIKSKSLREAVEVEDKLVIEYLSRSARVIGSVLGSIATLLNLDSIMLGGGVIEALNDFMSPKIRKAFNTAVLPEPGKIVKIDYTRLGDDAPLYGGIKLAQEFLES